MHKSQRDIDLAVRRLRGERLIPLGDLAGRDLPFNGVVLRPSADVWMRWGRDGRQGVYLDIVYSRRLAAWCTSRDAITRFEAGLAAKISRHDPDVALGGQKPSLERNSSIAVRPTAVRSGRTL